VELLTITAKTFFCFVEIGGIKESLNNDSQQFLQYQQNKRKVKQ
jgi:hypothetical protein